MEKKTRKITGYLVDVTNGTAKKATIEKSLAGYYAALNCDCIDIAQHEIGGKPFDIICDDEALLKADPRPSAFNRHYNPILCGSLFVVKFDGVDDVTDLTDDDIRHLKAYTMKVQRIVHDQKRLVWPVLVHVNNYGD